MKTTEALGSIRGEHGTSRHHETREQAVGWSAEPEQWSATERKALLTGDVVTVVRGGFAADDVGATGPAALMKNMSSAHDAKNYERGVREQRSWATRFPGVPVPRKFVTDDGFPVGTWCMSRRSERKAGTLAPEKERELTDAGMVWEPLRDQFLNGVEHLCEFVADNPGEYPPVGYKSPDGFKLGRWSHDRRIDYRRDLLAADEIDLLECAGMIWNPLEVNYARGLAELRKVMADRPGWYVTATFVTESGYKLGNWCNSRRMDRKHGRLSDEKYAELLSIGGVFR